MVCGADFSLRLLCAQDLLPADLSRTKCRRLQGRRLALSACRSVGLLHFLTLFFFSGPLTPVQGVLERVLELVAFLSPC
jgi:hypothetical protein